jgi:hypothetical protein
MLTQSLENYKELKDSKQWEFKEYKKSAEELILWCGDGDFSISKDGNKWVHKDTGQAWELAEPYRLRRYGKWSFCGNLGAQAGERSLAKPNTLRGIILCDIIDHMSSADFSLRPAATTRGTFAHLYETKQLRAGSRLTDPNQDLDLVVSLTLFHEMFHVVLEEKSWHYPFHPAI